MARVSRLFQLAGLHAYQVFVRPLSPSPPPLPAGITLRIIDDRQLGRFGDAALELDEVKASAAFARGEVCVAALLEDSLVGYAWFAQKAAPHVGGIWMDCDRQAVYVYRAFVKPEARGRGIAPALYRFADRQFMNAGRRYAVLCIEFGNRASLSAAVRSGAGRVGRAGYWQGFGGFVPYRSRGAAAVGFRFFIREK